MSDSKHIGQKLAEEMVRLDLKHHQVAAILGIKVPSVYSLIKTGSISKARYAKLEKVNGKPIQWWLNMEIPPPPILDVHPIQTFVGENTPDNNEAMLLALFRALPASEQRRLLDEMQQKTEHYEKLLGELLHRRKVA